MVWLLEKPLFIVAMGLLTAVVLGGLWLQTGSKGALRTFLIGIVVTAALLMVERFVTTDREQIESTLQRVARAVERNDVEEALRFAHSSATWMRQQARDELPRYVFHDVTIKPNLTVDVLPEHEPPRAVARFNVMVVLSDRDGILHERRIPRFVKVTFQKEEDSWRAIEYEHHDPYRGYRRHR
jgi:hypothetical protein